MAFEHSEYQQDSNQLTHQESVYFAEADVDTALENLTDPKIIKQQQVVKYAYNKATISGIDASYLHTLEEAVRTDNAIRGVAESGDSTMVDIGSHGLTELVVGSRANIETVNKSELDIDEATWKKYEEKSEQFLDPSIDDPRYKDNMTLAYARRQEIVTYFKQELGFQGKIVVLPPVVIFSKTLYQDDNGSESPLDEKTYTEVPGVTLRATYKVLTQKWLYIENRLNNRDIINFDKSDLEVKERDEKGRPTKLVHGNEEFAITGLGYARGERGMPIFVKNKIVQDANGNNTTKEVEYYMDFTSSSWMEFIE